MPPTRAHGMRAPSGGIRTSLSVKTGRAVGFIGKAPQL
jgi:hypothetical protein